MMLNEVRSGAYTSTNVVVEVLFSPIAKLAGGVADLSVNLVTLPIKGAMALGGAEVTWWNTPGASVANYLTRWMGGNPKSGWAAVGDDVLTAVGIVTAVWGGASLAARASGAVGRFFGRTAARMKGVKGSAEEFISVYHGTSRAGAEAIRKGGINLAKSRSRTDFGRGFYTTTDRVQAAKWAARNADGGEVLTFTIRKSELDALKNLSLRPGSRALRHFVSHFRRGGRMHSYDTVSGSMLRNVRAFLRGGPARWSGQQTSFHTKRSIEILQRGLVP